VDVNSEAPGAEFEWKGPTQAHVRINVPSQEPLDRVEVVFNGKVVLMLKESKAAVSVPIPEAGWLAVRCFGPAGETIHYAHSSPFYFLRNGKLPVKKADAARWANYIHQLAADTNPADYPSHDAYEKVRATYREAESVYRRRMD
jgi:hypothetical protein